MSPIQRYEQFIRDLKSDYRPQRQWSEGRGFFLIVGHFLVGCAAGTWLLARYYGVTDALVVAIVLGAFGGLAHLINLGRPERAVKMMAKVKTSWIARGFWGLTFLFLGAVLYLPPRLAAGLAWAADSPVALAGDVIAFVGAAILVGYMGFAYMVSKSIAFWNSKLHPVLYVGYSARSGAACLILVSALQSRAPQPGVLEFWMAATGLVIILWIIDLSLAPKHGLAARQSVRELLLGRLARVVYGGILALGIILPAVLIAGHSGALSQGALAAIGLASVISDFFIKYSSVKAGVHKRVRYLGPSMVAGWNAQGGDSRAGAPTRAG